MIYSKYFKAIINEGGIQNLAPSQITRMMNIIHLEGKIDGMHKLKEKLQGTSEAYRYDIDIFGVQKQLTHITGNLKPDALFKEFCFLSENEM